MTIHLGLPVRQGVAWSGFEISQYEPAISEHAKLLRERRVPDNFAISPITLVNSRPTVAAKELIGEGHVFLFVLGPEIHAVKIKVTQKLATIYKSPCKHGVDSVCCDAYKYMQSDRIAADTTLWNHPELIPE